MIFNFSLLNVGEIECSITFYGLISKFKHRSSVFEIRVGTNIHPEYIYICHEKFSQIFGKLTKHLRIIALNWLGN